MSVHDRFLRDMEYPATRDDLVREGATEGLSWSALRRLSDLPERSYASAHDVRTEMAKQDGRTLAAA